MTDTLALARRFREVIFDGTFVAKTNYKQELAHLDWEMATYQVPSLNTIATLTQHLHYYIKGLNEFFGGQELTIRDKYSFDFLPVTAQQEWETILTRFWNDAEAFASFIEQMPEEKLGSVFLAEKYGSYKRNIEAMIEHSYYHLGQIVLLKKIIANGQNT